MDTSTNKSPWIIEGSGDVEAGKPVIFFYSKIIRMTTYDSAFAVDRLGDNTFSATNKEAEDVMFQAFVLQEQTTLTVKAKTNSAYNTEQQVKRYEEYRKRVDREC